MVEPRAGLVHAVSELRHGLDDAVIDVEADGRRLGKWTGYVPGDGIAHITDVELDGTDEVVAVLTHPDVGRVENRYSRLVMEAVRRSRPG
jgi:hypothetical protein